MADPKFARSMQEDKSYQLSENKIAKVPTAYYGKALKGEYGDYGSKTRRKQMRKRGTK